MVKLLPLVTTVLFFNFVASDAHSSDMQLAESSLCNRYFSIYEKKYEMPNNMLRAVSVTESGKWHKGMNKNIAWPWTINVSGKGYQYDSKREAIAAVRDFQAKGNKSIDVGCMQINLRYHPEAFSSLEQAFEPKYNIEYAAKMLSAKFEKNGSWKTAIGHYHNADPRLGRKYTERVYSTWRIEDRAVSVAFLDSSSANITVKQRPAKPEADISAITKSALEQFAN